MNKCFNFKSMHNKKSWMVFAFILLLFPQFSSARVNVTDWYIQDFDSQIIVNKDSSLDITEKIMADCGNLPNKHGIFRILPTSVNVSGKKIQMPVKLLGITDQLGNKYAYQTIKNTGDSTVTWKIGDANISLQGVNTFIIKYKVKNAIRFNQGFDEFYWNLNGNFWEIQTDKFHASIKFPTEIDSKNSAIDYYTGYAGSKEKNLATYAWSSPNVLEFNSSRTLLEKQGITASVTFPKSIITPYVPSFMELYGQFLFLLIPFVVFLASFLTWQKYGKDPVMNKTVIAEYAPPGNLSPAEMGMLMKSGRFDNDSITAEIIWLATKGLISIKETESKILFFTSKDYELTMHKNQNIEATLNGAQKKILQGIFKEGDVVALSSLKNKFYKDLSGIMSATKAELKNKGLIQTTGMTIGSSMIGFSVLLFTLIVILMKGSGSSYILIGSLFLSIIIMSLFGFLMPKRTLQGAELNWQIEGFKLFMETVDKDRAVFYEKENIFEKCLPYAILFGMTKKWIKKMQEIYGENYYANHAPIWYVGSMSSFDADNFASTIDGLSSSIAQSTSSPSGSGGSGGSGGGGGGGGGGGW